jgi:ribonuclease T2
MKKQPPYQTPKGTSTSLGILTLSLIFFGNAFASPNCVDPQDTYQHYDKRIREDTIKPIDSEYYVLSYSWAPDHCAKIKARHKRPGSKEYLQCGSGRKYGYIVHGLWPQGKFNKRGGYPRACLGDQPKIPRSILNNYLCMTPSVGLLQHEYENHGTCMHDASLTNPKAYFDKALELHKQLLMPSKKLGDSAAAKRWFVKYNPHLRTDMFYHDNHSEEWRFCYNNAFKPIRCPGKKAVTSSRSKRHKAYNCPIKGNISRKTKQKKYYLPDHKYYKSMRITPATGERCFTTEQEAIAAGWKKAR